MSTLTEKVSDFLAQKHIAVAGVSRNPQGGAANAIFKKPKESGYQVYPINPKTDNMEGEHYNPDLKSIPAKIDGVVICTPAQAVAEIVGECATLGIPRVWMHRVIGPGSVFNAAIKLCQGNKILVIAGACSLMYCQPVDFGHKCLHWMLGIFGKLPN
jgi:predicted CoA-binding protein